jgi:hypothetical protein
MRTMRERVWEAANVKLEVVTIDTDTTVHSKRQRKPSVPGMNLMMK